MHLDLLKKTCACLLLVIAVLASMSTITPVSAVEFRFEGVGAHIGRLLMQVSANTNWGTISASNFGEIEAYAACRFLGYSDQVTATIYGSVAGTVDYPIMFDGLVCLSPPVAVNMSDFGTYCIYKSLSVPVASSAGAAVRLGCAETGVYTGLSIGAYAGVSTSGGSSSVYVRLNQNRFEFRYSHTVAWFSLCASVWPNQMTGRAMCFWLKRFVSSVTLGVSTPLSPHNMRSLSCPSYESPWASCTKTVSTTCALGNGTNSAVTLTCNEEEFGNSTWIGSSYNSDPASWVVILLPIVIFSLVMFVIIGVSIARAKQRRQVQMQMYGQQDVNLMMPMMMMAGGAGSGGMIMMGQPMMMGQPQPMMMVQPQQQPGGMMMMSALPGMPMMGVPSPFINQQQQQQQQGFAQQQQGGFGSSSAPRAPPGEEDEDPINNVQFNATPMATRPPPPLQQPQQQPAGYVPGFGAFPPGGFSSGYG